MAHERTVRLHSHDDGVNAWEMARIGPPPRLAGLIEGYADYAERTAGFTSRRELPHAEGVLIVNLGPPIAITGGDGALLRLGPGEGFVAGVHLRPALSHSNGTQAGMHVFLPLAALRRLLDVPMDNLVDQVVPLYALSGIEGRRLGERLGGARDRAGRIAILDEALADRFKRTRALPRDQAHALTLLRHRPDLDIAEIAREIGWSRKHLATRIKDAVGIGPRSFRRLQRFQTLTASIGDKGSAPDWAGLAHDAGYCDQSHMIREFREFAAMTPSDFVARSLPAGGGLVEA